MVPSGFHAPPRLAGALANAWGSPPARSIRFSLPPAKKPIDRLSGLQNGYSAYSVPTSGCAPTASSARSHKRGSPSPDATNTRRPPSGERAKWSGLDVAGVVISTRISGVDGVGRGARAMTRATAETPANNAAAVHARRSRPLRGAAGDT